MAEKPALHILGNNAAFCVQFGAQQQPGVLSLTDKHRVKDWLEQFESNHALRFEQLSLAKEPS